MKSGGRETTDTGEREGDQKNWSEDEIERSACVYKRNYFFVEHVRTLKIDNQSQTTTLAHSLFLCPISFCPFFFFSLKPKATRPLGSTVLICMTLNSWQLGVEKKKTGREKYNHDLFTQISSVTRKEDL